MRQYTLDELREVVKNATDVELYQFKDKDLRIHTDTVVPMDSNVIEQLFEFVDEIEAEVELMDKERYSETLLANCGVEWDEMFDDDDIVAVIVTPTYDVEFNDDESTDIHGMRTTKSEARWYIQRYNGTDLGFFADYKSGDVCVVCRQTGETFYHEAIGAREKKNCAVEYFPDGNTIRFVGSMEDYRCGGLSDPVMMTRSEAEELVSQLDEFVKHEYIGDNDSDNEQAHRAYEHKEWGFGVFEYDFDEEIR